MEIRATVVMARSAPPRSIERIRAAGADLRLTADMSSAFVLLRELVDEGMTLVHPFDDPVVVAGQGTVGLEFADAAPHLTDVLVSIGGGALIAGVAVALKASLPDVRVWGVETEGADAMARALAAGWNRSRSRRVRSRARSAPRTSPQLTLEHVQQLAEEVFVVSDADAMRGVVEFAGGEVSVEPATGCPGSGGARGDRTLDNDVSLGFVVCGGNVTLDDVRSWVDRLL